MRDVCADFGAELTEFNIDTDHIHLLVHYPPKIALARLVGSLKGVSARRTRQEFPTHIRKYLWDEHLWSPPYLAASCGGAPADRQGVHRPAETTGLGDADTPRATPSGPKGPGFLAGVR
jgi:putative transposase